MHIKGDWRHDFGPVERANFLIFVELWGRYQFLLNQSTAYGPCEPPPSQRNWIPRKRRQLCELKAKPSFSLCFETNVLFKRVEATGVTIRAPIGLLIWMRTEEKTATYGLGSRLKTPVFPIWLVVASEQCGVLFSDDRELLRDYRSEIRFPELNSFHNNWIATFWLTFCLIF